MYVDTCVRSIALRQQSAKISQQRVSGPWPTLSDYLSTLGSTRIAYGFSPSISIPIRTRAYRSSLLWYKTTLEPLLLFRSFPLANLYVQPRRQSKRTEREMSRILLDSWVFRAPFNLWTSQSRERFASIYFNSLFDFVLASIRNAQFNRIDITI